MRAVAALTPKNAAAPDVPRSRRSPFGLRASHAIDAMLSITNSLADFHTGEKGFTLSKRGELAVLDELARAMPQGGLELAEPACWGAAASNASSRAAGRRGAAPVARARRGAPSRRRGAF